MHSIADWLGSLALAQYTQAFADNGVDLGVLPSLSEQDLEDLGVASPGHRNKLLRAIGELAPAASEVAKPAAPVSAVEGGERRQLAVLFCDMVGFTQLASRLDPEVLQHVVRTYEDTCAGCIARFDGYVFQRLGDGIVAFFGYPRAHEGEAERAIRAALAIVDALAALDIPAVGRLAVRIGIATGVVVVAPGERGAVGATMNLAARLQGIAPVGGIAVSERVRRLAGGNFVYRSLGAQSLNGIGAPTTPYLVTGESGVASRFEAATERGVTALIGRERELASLSERWRQVLQGEGQVVVLGGEPGIGKSRVVKTLLERCMHEGAMALRFQCSPYHTTSAFYPTIDHLERVLHLERGEPADTKLDKLEALMVQRLGLPRDDVVYLAALLSIPFEVRYGANQMSAQRFKRETLRCLADANEAAARRQPCVLLFEDAHWADPTSLEGLDVLIERVRAFPMLVVITHRPEFEPHWHHLDHVTALNVPRLTNAHSRAIVHQLTAGKTLPARVLDQILARTDGVPLFVEELTQAILESGELRDAGDHFEASGAELAVNIPASLRDSMMARLDRQGAAKEIAQIGAVIGRVFSWELVHAVSAMPRTELDRALAQLADSGLASCRGSAPAASYTFRHALVQDVAYDSLLKSRRQELHAAIAHALESSFPERCDTEPELLAHHFGAAGRFERSIAYAHEAAKRAATRSAYVEALALLDAAQSRLASLPAGHARVRLQLQLQLQRASALIVTESYSAPATGAAWAEARRLCDELGDDAPETPSALFGFALFQLTCGDMRGADATARTMLRLAPRGDDPMLPVMAHRLLGSLHFYRGAPGEAQTSLAHALRAYDAQHRGASAAPIGADQKASGLAYQSLALHLLGRPDQAFAAGEEALRHAKVIGHELGIAAITWFTVHLALHRREPQRALERARFTMALAERHGFPLWHEISKLGCGAALLQLGDAEQGRELIQQWLTRSEAMGYRAVRGFALATAAQAEVALQRWDAAEQLFDATEREIEATDERWYEAEVYRLRGEALRRRHGAAGAGMAQQLYERALAVAQRQGARCWALRAGLSLARLWQSQGQGGAARAMLEPICHALEEGNDLQDAKDARAMLDELAR